MNEPGSAVPGRGEGSSNSHSEKASIILGSRASISRNLSNHKFPSSCSNEEKNQITGIIRNCARRTKGLSELCFLRISRITKTQRQVLLGDYQIEDDFISTLSGRGILVMPRHSIREVAKAIPLCWDDHLKIQAAAPGNTIDELYSIVSETEKLFESKLNFSFSKEWGYLTSNPASLGTALEISILVHLPALAISPDIADFIKNLSKVGCSVGGYAGKNTEVTGNIFRISSSRTLGKSEEEIVEEMNAICLNIVDEEEGARRKLIEKDRLGAKDNVYRSYGLLKYAKILSFEEALELLSILRLGLDLGIIEKIRDFDYFEIINMIGDAHIISGFEMGDKATDDDIDLKRAELIRDRILED
jgi:protein arginine kinase